MVTPKTLIRIAKRWQKAAAGTRRRRRILLPRIRKSSAAARVAEKGHFVAYTVDQKRCVLPIGYLRSHVFRELLKMAEEEFGLPRDGPITLPCEAAFVEYAVSLIRRHVDREVEKALLLSVSPPPAATICSCRSGSSSFFSPPAGEAGRRVMVCGS